MLLYEVLAETDTKRRLNRAYEEADRARLARIHQRSSESPVLNGSLSERLLALMEWQGTLRVRLGPAFDF